MKQYQSKEWLYKKYWIENLSQNKIAKISKTSQMTICRRLKDFDISCRSRSKAVHLGKANHCNLSGKAIELFNGELLGDGSLTSRNIYSAVFKYGSKYEKYVKFISNILKSVGIKQTGKILKQYHKKFKKYAYHYNSCAYAELKDLYNKWYPNGKKIVPKDIELTPLTCRQWYIGDGSLEHQKYCRPFIRLYTMGFTICDVNWLVKKLIKLGFKTTRQLSQNRIYISSYSTKDFLNYIGKCPVKCYEYKWI